MFNFFKRSSPECPVSEETRLWMERCFLWMMKTFGEENIKNRKVLVPEPRDFPVKYDGSRDSAFETMKIVAAQMEIDPDEIVINVYSEGQSALSTGEGRRIFLQNAEGQKYSGGLYFGKQDDNRYHISIEKKKLNDPVAVVATLAHELSHVKLLGEKKLEKNNEHLTDLLTIVFGLGIFNANMSFQTKAGYNSWGWSRSGYLSQMEWGYGLALFAHIRGEARPEWMEHLSRNVKTDMKKGLEFIKVNPKLIFKTVK